MGQLQIYNILAATLIILQSCLAAPTYDLTSTRKDGLRLPLKRANPRDIQGLSRRDLLVDLTNEIGYYYIELAIGSPPQDVQLHIDTGSGEIWIAAPSACADCTNNVYDPTLSTSVNTTTGLGAFAESYKDGTAVEGYYVTDTVGLGGTDVTNVYLGVATNVTTTITGLHGIMGISFDTDRPKYWNYPGFLDLLTSEDIISSNTYSIYLDNITAQTGSIIFGGVDSTKYTGDLVPLPIVTDDGLYVKLQVSWSALTVTNSSGASEWLTQAGQSNTTLLDTGSTFTTIPSDIFSALAESFGVSGAASGDYTISCEMPGGFLSFGFGDGPAVWIDVPFSELAVPWGNGCQFGLRPVISDGDIISFGDTFIRSAYMNVNFDNFTIALAQSAWQ